MRCQNLVRPFYALSVLCLVYFIRRPFCALLNLRFVLMHWTLHHVANTVVPRHKSLKLWKEKTLVSYVLVLPMRGHISCRG